MTRRLVNIQRMAHTCASGSMKILLVMLAMMLVELLSANLIRQPGDPRSAGTKASNALFQVR